MKMAFVVLRHVIGASRPCLAFAVGSVARHQSRIGFSLGQLEKSLLRLTTSLNGIYSFNPGFEQRRNYAMRLELKEHGIHWRRPEYVPSWNPAKSGDLESHVDPNQARLPLKLMVAKEAFEEADEVTKRLLSVEFSAHKESMKLVRYDTLRNVQRHKYDVGSMECKVAMLTVKIRNLQDKRTSNNRNTIEKGRLIELIAHRKKLLKHLRRMDYKRFEWLIEELNIEYKPFPTAYHWITRKDSLRKLVQMHKDDIKRERLEIYKEVLEAQKEPFLKEKAETLQWIAKTEAEIGVPITVEDPVSSKS